ncbi:MFS transporter [Actinomadura rupiterrae]|uniref:MFS transporter n=1 Tax=Actinomadura rupiterrae TaxID=559627 RepID=UPI0020A30069|nr:MFS transporter [Actinomadura rupiterrae]MCP2338638.1 EmrB/QacA subfamily drug resistance transporter [Actinomadura rupiterrae]
MSTETVRDSTASGTAGDRAWALALAAIVGAEFMLQLDGTVVNVALPALQDDLGLGVAPASWVPNGFLLAFGGLLLLAGRLGDVLGHRRVFLSGVALVVAASLVAGLAPDLPVLLAGRVGQGAGAALAGPAGLALLATLSEGERRQRAFGLYSTVTGLGASAGMVLGGLLTWAGDWRWSLLVNVPVGLVLLGLAVRVLGFRDEDVRSRALGVPSAVLATGALAATVYSLVHAAERGWGEASTAVLLAVSAVLWAALFLLDRRAAEPLLPLALFAERRRAGAVLSLLLLAAVLTGFLVYLVQYLQNTQHMNALESGLAILPFGLALLATTQLLTKHVARFDLRTRAVGGLVVVLAGVLWLTRLDGASGYPADVLPALVLMGAGVGLAIVPMNMIVLTTAPPEYAGVAAGVLQTALTVGGSLGLAVLLVPFIGGGGVSGVFTWAAVALVAAVLVQVALWFGPRRGAPGAS